MTWYLKTTAKSRLKSGLYKGKKVVKVHSPKGKSFKFRSGGKNIKRKTGYDIV